MAPQLYFVELTVSDWSAAARWYHDVLGLQVLLQVEADRFALLGAGPARVALKAGVPSPGTVLLTFVVDDLPAELDRLAAFGVHPTAPPKASPEGYRRALFCDPDGYPLCLFDWGAAAATASAGKPVERFVP
jgi:predicted enzyme related to lactoylglutathione lyase